MVNKRTFGTIVRNGTVATATNIQSVRPVLKKIENRLVLVENVL
jgi:hypothetical protein